MTAVHPVKDALNPGSQESPCTQPMYPHNKRLDEVAKLTRCRHNTIIPKLPFERQPILVSVSRQQNHPLSHYGARHPTNPNCLNFLLNHFLTSEASLHPSLLTETPIITLCSQTGHACKQHHKKRPTASVALLQIAFQQNRLYAARPHLCITR